MKIYLYIYEGKATVSIQVRSMEMYVDARRTSQLFVEL